MGNKNQNTLEDSDQEYEIERNEVEELAKIEDTVLVNGVLFQALEEQESLLIEETYQMYQVTKSYQETYIQAKDDIYLIKFTKDKGDVWDIVNISN